MHKFIENTKVEGPGLRDCIYVQGCSIHCKNCNSPETWDPSKGKNVNIQILSEKIINNKKIEGVTFSGGEPLDQAEVLFELGKIIKKTDLSIVTYTGYSYEFINKSNNKNWKNLISISDILISEPYKDNLKNFNKAWIGSSNQKIHFITNRYNDLKGKINNIPNKVEIRFKKNGEIIVNGIGEQKEIINLLKK